MNVNKNTDVRKWYHYTYPNDELYLNILPEYSFIELFKILDAKIYSYMLFGYDSVIRERILTQLAEIMGVEYGCVHDQWLQCRCVDPVNPFDNAGIKKTIKYIYELFESFKS